MKQVFAEKLDPSPVLDMKVDLDDVPKRVRRYGYTPYDQGDGPALVLKEASLRTCLRMHGVWWWDE